MVDWGGLFASGFLATGLPTLIGILVAYSIVSLVLGAFLWPVRAIPDGTAFAIAGSGAVTGILVVVGYFVLRFVVF